MNRRYFHVGLPLLTLFYEDVRPQWRNQLISTLEKIFTGLEVPIEEVIQNINIKIRETSLKPFDLKTLAQTALLGLILLEFLINLNGVQQNERILENQTPITKGVEQVQAFIKNHGDILVNGTREAIFAIGICVGVLLEVQENKYDKTAPYWERLNRLDLDLERIIEFLPEVKTKLAMYKIRDHKLSGVKLSGDELCIKIGPIFTCSKR
jgi:CRISPR-associated protein Cas8b/Csh1 subtype I-B